MLIDSVEGAFENGLSQWLESEDAHTVQRQLEQKIAEVLFGNDSTSPAFQRMVAQLAWIGSRPAAKPLLQREIFALALSEQYSVEPCNFFKEIKKAAGAVKKFVKDHAKDIALGAALCATGAGIAAAAGYSLSVSIAGLAIMGSDSIFHAKEEPNPYIPPLPLPDPKACSQEELAVIQQSLPNPLPKIDLPSSSGKILITADGIWANGQFFSTEGIKKHSLFSSAFQEHALDWQTFHSYLSWQQETTGDISFCARGENALILKNYDQAIHDLGKAIEENPNNPLSYLERSAAHFGLGEYDRSLEDYQRFTSQIETSAPPSISEFCLGFAKGLPQGTYESGEGILLFLVDFVKHPVQTSKQAIDSITVLVSLVRRDEWGIIAEALSPEMHQLVTQWDTLSSEKRGELTGYAVGKLGADFLVPGALAKVASKSVKSAQELVTICKNLRIAQETLVLETAAGIGDTVTVAEIVQNSQMMRSLAEKSGLSGSEIAQLKQAGSLEGTIANNLERFANNPALKESYELFKNAQEFLAPYSKKPMLESRVRELIQSTGIQTFPRPRGIPENFLLMVSDRGAGMEYVHPTNTHIRIRIMPGKPHSPYPHQQKPYVIQKIDGQFLDKYGNIVNKNAPEAHIPLEEFSYRG